VSDRIRFHCDEHIDPAIASGLRRRGIDVTTTVEAGLLGATDEQHLEFARTQQRLVITKDTDFLRLSTRGEEHHGIGFCQQGARTVGQMLASLIHIYEELTSEEVKNRTIYL
jgi:predicted nuclease of predicted toxin-antitoxin system